MKAAGKGKNKDDGEMRPTWWRPFPSVSDETRKLSILPHVDPGELALAQMSAECERCRMLDVIMKAFCHLTGCPNWEEAQAKYGPYASDERLYSFEKSFELMLEDEHGSANDHEEELEELPGQSEGGEADAGAEDVDSVPLVVGDSLAADPKETDP
ncbi:hypothetical protein R1sor_000081 [Riccia sorocarpa]|uniref:Uncharacterized protein n=1 Tax=Riccia sorocarpa TaxID=122646 RepID=A0ABD3GW37_9MARC